MTDEGKVAPIGPTPDPNFVNPDTEDLLSQAVYLSNSLDGIGVPRTDDEGIVISLYGRVGIAVNDAVQVAKAAPGASTAPDGAPAGLYDQTPSDDGDLVTKIAVLAKHLAGKLQQAVATSSNSTWLQQALSSAREIEHSLETHAKMTANK